MLLVVPTRCWLLCEWEQRGGVNLWQIDLINGFSSFGLLA